jgi:hypothetical protein
VAEKCWSIFSFYGNNEVVARVTEWIGELNQIESNAIESDATHSIMRIFYPEIGTEAIDFGTKSIYPDLDVLSENSIGFITAWTPPNAFQDHITNLLIALDEEVVVKNYFHTETNGFGYRYTTSDGGEGIYEQHGYVDRDDCSSDEDEDEMVEELEELLKEYERDSLENLLDDFPGRKKRLKPLLQYFEIH